MNGGENMNIKEKEKQYFREYKIMQEQGLFEDYNFVQFLIWYITSLNRTCIKNTYQGKKMIGGYNCGSQIINKLVENKGEENEHR